MTQILRRNTRSTSGPWHSTTQTTSLTALDPTASRLEPSSCPLSRLSRSNKDNIQDFTELCGQVWRLVFKGCCFSPNFPKMRTETIPEGDLNNCILSGLLACIYATYNMFNLCVNGFLGLRDCYIFGENWTLDTFGWPSWFVLGTLATRHLKQSARS